MDQTNLRMKSSDQFLSASCSCTGDTGCTGTNQSGDTRCNASSGYTGCNASSGYTGCNASSGYTGCNASSGYTGCNASSGYTGCNASSGYTGCTGPNQSGYVEQTLTVRRNAFASDVPDRFPRYRHGSHPHRLYVLFGIPNHRCDNANCRRPITSLETRFSCMRCDFDLCDRCFQLGPEVCVPINEDEDRQINDLIFSGPVEKCLNPVKIDE